MLRMGTGLAVATVALSCLGSPPTAGGASASSAADVPPASCLRPVAAVSVLWQRSADATDIAPLVYRIQTRKKVVFLTIDDGWTRDPLLPRLMRRTGVPTSLFLIRDAADNDWDYFRRLQKLGGTVEDHTLWHPDCSKLTFTEQKHQICASAHQFAAAFGRRPTLFRAPYGSSDLRTQRAAAACRMDAVVNWDVTVNDGRLAYAAGSALQPGDIILMHFTPNVRRDFRAAVSAAAAAGLTIARLEDYLSSSSTSGRSALPSTSPAADDRGAAVAGQPRAAKEQR